jgi:hypothetical protein
LSFVVHVSFIAAMSALLKRLRAAGLTVRIEGGHLLVRPRSRLTDDLRTLLREHKPWLLKLKALQPVSVPPWPQPGYLSPELLEVLAIPLRSCQDCDQLEGWTFCEHYRRQLPEPELPCRCVHFRPVAVTGVSREKENSFARKPQPAVVFTPSTIELLKPYAPTPIE